MGIRVNKRMGWGLADLQTDKDGEIIDPRINKEGYLFDPDEENFSIEEYFNLLEEYYEKNKDDILRNPEIILDYFAIDDMKKEKIQLYDCIGHDSEFGIPNVLHFVPPVYVKDWTRYNDSIDYYEESINHEQHSRFQLLNRPIYPYEHYIDIDSLNEEGYPTRIHFWDRLRVAEAIFNNLPITEVKKEKMEEIFGFSTKEEYDRRIIPAIPNGLIAFIKYTKIFTDDKFIFDLRPMIYVYWA